MIETGKYNNQFYRNLPSNAREGELKDFLEHGLKKVGMQYLVYSSIREVYDIQTVRPGTTGAKIKEYIDAGILFIISENNHNHGN